MASSTEGNIMARKFYRTVVQYEILSEGPLDDELTLSDIQYLCEEEGCSGKFLDRTQTEVTGKEMVELALKQGTDPDFFMLDENGDDTDEASWYNS